MLPGLETYKDDLSPLHHPYSIFHIDIHTHAQTILYVLGVAPRAMLCRAKLLYFTEDLLNMSLMCSREGGKSSIIQYGSNEKEIKDAM